MRRPLASILLPGSVLRRRFFSGKHPDHPIGAGGTATFNFQQSEGPRLIDVLDLLGTREVHCLLHGGRNDVAHTLLCFAERSAQHLHPEYVAQKHHGLTTAHATAARQQSLSSQSPRGEHRARHSGGQRRSRAMPALVAVCRVQPVFRYVGPDLRKAIT